MVFMDEPSFGYGITESQEVGDSNIDYRKILYKIGYSDPSKEKP